MDFRKQNQEAFQKKFGIKLGFMSAFLKASAYALQDQPVVNAVIDGTDIIYRDYVDISVAVATPKGLVVPVLRNVERMNFADIELGLAALGEKARKGMYLFTRREINKSVIEFGLTFSLFLNEYSNIKAEYETDIY